MRGLGTQKNNFAPNPIFFNSRLRLSVRRNELERRRTGADEKSSSETDFPKRGRKNRARNFPAAETLFRSAEVDAGDVIKDDRFRAPVDDVIAGVQVVDRS